MQFIKRAQALDFSFREVKELLALREVHHAGCGDVVVLTQPKIEEIDAKIGDLQAMRADLSGLLKECTGTDPIAECPIIESLGDEPKSEKKS